MGPSGWLSRFLLGERTIVTIQDRAPVAEPLLVLTAANCLIAVSMYPAFVRAVSSQGLVAARLAEMVFWVTIGAYPFLTLLKAGVLGATGWAIAAVAGVTAPFRRLFSLLLHAEILLLAQMALSVVVLHLRGLETIGDPADLLVYWGLDFFWEPESVVLKVVLANGGVFHALWIVFVSSTLSRVAAMPRRGAFAAALGMWLVAAGLQVSRAVALG